MSEWPYPVKEPTYPATGQVMGHDITVNSREELLAAINTFEQLAELDCKYPPLRAVDWRNDD